jgi:hypothetical protein
MRGILFTEPLFHQVVCGGKTQTRRIVNSRTGFFKVESKDGHVTGVWQCDANEWVGDDLIPVKPRYKVGETLYLKEPYRIEYLTPWRYIIEYGYDRSNIPVTPIVGVWENKLFMPAKYARYFIEITGVRCERLQDISDEDCFKEGIMESDQKGVFFSNAVQYGGARAGICKPFESPQIACAALIDSIGGKGAWERNPFVFVYDFKLTAK